MFEIVSYKNQKFKIIKILFTEEIQNVKSYI